MTKLQALRGCVLVAVLATAGCYKYIPVQPEAAPVGQDVRIAVTRMGAAELAEVAPDAVPSGTITGRLERFEDDDMFLSVPVGERHEGFMTLDLTQTIRVPMGEILQVERRELDKVGTGVLIGAVAAAGAGVVFGIIQAFGNAPPPDEGPPVEDFTFVLGRFSFPFGH